MTIPVAFLDATDPGSVIIFDLKTLSVIDKVRVGDDPNGIIFDHKIKRIFTADRGSKRVTAIDAKTGKVVAISPDLEITLFRRRLTLMRDIANHTATQCP